MNSADVPVGVVVTLVVAGGPAARAGIAVGELIVAVGQKQTRTTTDLAEALADLSPGSSTQVTVIAADRTQRTVTVSVAQLPSG